MSVVGRAARRARRFTGNRRVLYAMSEPGNTYNRAYKKSARVVGDVIGNTTRTATRPSHDTIVRMAQPWSLRYPAHRRAGQLSLGRRRCAGGHAVHRRSHGASLADEMLSDLDKDTVDFAQLRRHAEGAAVFPARFPTSWSTGPTASRSAWRPRSRRTT